jgi:rhamnosyltransferase
MPDPAAATVSVILRTRNEARALPGTVAAIRTQMWPAGAAPEMIFVDSGSTDGTLQIARELGVDRSVDLSDEPFSFGRALNRGAAQAAGDVLVALSAHARPAHDRWLEHLLRPLVDPAVGGVYGAQWPWSDAWLPVALDYRRCYRNTPLVHHTPEDAYFSNANAALRRSVWQEIPFDEDLPACEDQDWARRAIARGWAVAYAPEAAVYHSHNEWPLQLCRRRAREERGWRRVTGRKTRLRDLLSDWWERSRADVAEVRAGRGSWRWCVLSPLYRFLWAVSPWYPYG